MAGRSGGQAVGIMAVLGPFGLRQSSAAFGGGRRPGGGAGAVLVTRKPAGLPSAPRLAKAAEGCRSPKKGAPPAPPRLYQVERKMYPPRWHLYRVGRRLYRGWRNLDRMSTAASPAITAFSYPGTGIFRPGKDGRELGTATPTPGTAGAWRCFCRSEVPRPGRAKRCRINKTVMSQLRAPSAR